MQLRIALFLVLAAVPLAACEKAATMSAPMAEAANQRSYEDVLARITPVAAPEALPSFSGAGDVEIVQGLLLPFLESSRVRAAQEALIRDPSDLRRGPKLLHPKGVCASATWEISAATPYTGLFAQGASVRSIVRLSTGGNNTGPDKQILSITNRLIGLHRMFGLAVKLFPAPSAAAPSATLNVVAFDNLGPDGNPSQWYMRNAASDDDNTQFFSNWMFGLGPLSEGFAWQFLRRWEAVFAELGIPGTPEPRLAAVRPLAGVDAQGQPVAQPSSPRFVKFVPRARYVEPTADFRDELLGYDAGELTFDLVLPAGEDPSGVAPADTVVGKLTLGKPFVSESCDLDLRFVHYGDTK